MTANVDPAFQAVPPNSTAFLIWRIEVSDTLLIWTIRGKNWVDELKRKFSKRYKFIIQDQALCWEQTDRNSRLN
jgi:hypothetical protein